MELFRLLGTIAIQGADDANDAMDNVTDNAKDSSNKMVEAFKKVGGAIGTFLAVDKIKDFGVACVTSADSMKQAMNDFAAETGATADSLSEYEDVLQSIYDNNFGESFEDIADSMAKIKQQAGDIGADELESMTTNAIMLRDTFDFEVSESMRAAQMLMDQFGITGEEAFNLIAQGAQNGLDKNGDLLDSINEYSVHYEQLGFTAEDFFNSLANGTEAGTFSVDKLGDAMKEFGIRVKDGSDTSAAAFESLGYDAEDMFQIFNEGGEGAAKATQEIIDKLAAMPDGIDKTTTGVNLFGTMWEDLGEKGIQALSDLDGSITTTKDALSQINEVKYDSLSSALEGVKRKVETSLLVPFGEKLIPVVSEVGEVIQQLADGDITGVFDKLASIPEKINGLVPSLVAKGAELITKLGEGIKENLSVFASNALDAVDGFATMVAENAPTLIQAGLDMLKNLASGIMDSVPVLIEKVPTIISKFASVINNNAPKVLKAGFDIIVTIVKGIINAIPTLVANVPKIIQAILDVWTAFNWLNLGKNVVKGISDGITKVINLVKDAGTNISKSLTGTVQHLPSTLMNLGRNLVTNFSNTIRNLLGSVTSAGRGIFNSLFNTVSSLPSKMLTLGSDIVKGLWNGISDMGGWIASKIQGFGEDVLGSLKSFFGIHSPSTLMRDEVGKYLVEGIGVGVEENEESAIQPFNKVVNSMIPSAQATLNQYVNVPDTASNDNDILTKIYNLLLELLPQLANMQLVTDTGVLAGELAPAMDDALGRLAARKERQ